MITARLRSLPGTVAVAIALGMLVVAISGLVALADGDLLATTVGEAVADPLGVGLVVGALLGAFSARALAWCRLLPRLSFGQALAAIHVATGANHVLPFRLGEPLRIVSAVRRGGISLGPATSTTVVLRAADVVALLVLGVIVGPSLAWSLLGPWGVAAGAVVGCVGLVAVVVVVRQRDVADRPRLPDTTTVALVVVAWLLEAVVVWQTLSWVGVDVTPAEAVLVLSLAVSAQIIAVTPGGIGTYEAAASAALVATGVPLTTAVTAAVALHGAKTIYTLVAGGIGVAVPAPGLAGRLRLPTSVADRPAPAPGDGPIVLFLPARNEAPRISEVIAAAPAEIAGRRVEVVVVDDGSTDDTAERARGSGATVVTHPQNQGLGAAVRTGFVAGHARGAAAVAFCDADGEYDPAELHRLVEPILAGDAHYVVGSRFAGRIHHMRPHRRFGNHVLTRLVRFVVRRPVTDGQSGYRALSGPAAAAVEVAHDYNYAQVLTIDLVAKGFGYREVPITYAFRTSGRSFVRLGTYLRRVVPTVWRQLNPVTVTITHEEAPRAPAVGSDPSPLSSR